MINLLPDEIKEKRKREKYKRISIVIITLVLVGVVWTSSYIQNLVVDYQTEIKRLNNQLQQLESSKEVLAGELKEKSKMQDKLNLVTNLEDDLNYSWLIKDLNLIIPQGVGLEQLIIEADNNLLVGGRANSNKLLLETANRLQKYPYFEGVKISSSQKVANKLHFIIKGRVRTEL